MPREPYMEPFGPSRGHHHHGHRGHRREGYPPPPPPHPMQFAQPPMQPPMPYYPPQMPPYYPPPSQGFPSHMPPPQPPMQGFPHPMQPVPFPMPPPPHFHPSQQAYRSDEPYDSEPPLYAGTNTRIQDWREKVSRKKQEDPSSPNASKDQKRPSSSKHGHGHEEEHHRKGNGNGGRSSGTSHTRGHVEAENGPRPVYRRGQVDLDEPPAEYIRGPTISIRPSGRSHGKDPVGQSQSQHEGGGHRKGSVGVEQPDVKGRKDGDNPEKDGKQKQVHPHQSRKDSRPAVNRQFPPPPGFEPWYHTDEYQNPFAFGTQNTGE